MPQPLFAPPDFREREMMRQLLRLQAAAEDVARAEAAAAAPADDAPAAAVPERTPA